MFYPTILPDEFHEGYYGRFVSINALPDKAQNLFSIVRSHIPLKEFSCSSPSMIELLAYCANMPLPQFVRAHTLMPYRRSVASHKSELVHGDANDRAMIRCAGTRLARPGSYLCVGCVNKDIKATGMSYWHRSHQLPGMYVCPEHGQVLRYVDCSTAFLSAPSSYIDAAYLIDDQWAVESHAHPAVSRFLSFSQTLASGERPFQVKKIRPLLMTDVEFTTSVQRGD